MTPRLARVITFVFLLAGTIFAQLQPSNLIANVPARTRINLNGRWRSIVDPYEVGGWTHFERNAKPRDKAELVEYDFDQSQLLAIPSDWNSQRDDLFFYEGSVWYKTSFNYNKREHTRQFLYFGGANYRATVFLNGKKLGEHIGGFTPFNFEVTDSILEGDNLLVVQVNNARHAEDVPALNTDWWNYGGITRDVTLVEVPETFVQDYFVQLAKGSQNEIAGWVTLNGGAQSQQVTIDIPEAKVRQVVTTDANGRAEFRYPAKLTLWSPKNPKLYDVIITTPTDSVRDMIGFRTVETRGTQILLNGKPVFLRGISIHEEAPYRGGRAVSPEDDQTLLGWAKELGCNFVRLAHYPHNEHMTRLADKLGLLVWSEVPVYWGLAWQNPATLENARAQLRDNIARDHNRASIVFWSVANETPIEPGRLEFLKRLTDDVRAQDSTRLVTAAMNTAEYPAPNVSVLNDKLGEYLDVLGWNEYLGWYGGKPEDADRMEWKTAFNKPLIISEFGGGAVFGRHGDPGTRWTEEYQASIFEHQINSLRRIPSLAGMSPWVLMDFRSPRRLLPGTQDYRNRKGVLSDRGERKKAFYVLQRFYREKVQ